MIVRLLLRSFFIVQILFACALIFTLPASAQWLSNSSSAKLKHDEVWIHLSNNEALLFQVELAQTPDEQQTGLMNRTHLAEDAGMLFLFNEEEKRSFWMKDTLIPLDILFLTKDGIIHHIHHMATPQSEALITSIRPSYAVLEINGGYSDALGIKEGDRVLHPTFRNTIPY